MSEKKIKEKPIGWIPYSEEKKFSTHFTTTIRDK